MFTRRTFLALPAAAWAANSLPTRQVKVETVFKSPGPQPNGLQATRDGLWMLDQGNDRAYLVDYKDGKVLRDIATGSNRGSGITFDGEALWIASTYDCKIIRTELRTGQTLEDHPTPGCGAVNWPNPRKSPLAKPAPPPKPKPAGDSSAATAAPAQRQSTGAHGLEWRDGKLWIAVPPSQTIYCMDPKKWEILKQFKTAGDRPHGLGWDGNWLWCADSNDNAFYKYDTKTGTAVEKIQLADSDPLPHGATIWRNTMWYCDDVGVVCRFSLKG